MRQDMAECVPTPQAVVRQRKQRGESDVEHWGFKNAGEEAVLKP